MAILVVLAEASGHYWRLVLPKNGRCTGVRARAGGSRGPRPHFAQCHLVAASDGRLSAHSSPRGSEPRPVPTRGAAGVGAAGRTGRPRRPGRGAPPPPSPPRPRGRPKVTGAGPGLGLRPGPAVRPQSDDSGETFQNRLKTHRGGRRAPGGRQTRARVPAPRAPRRGPAEASAPGPRPAAAPGPRAPRPQPAFRTKFLKLKRISARAGEPGAGQAGPEGRRASAAPPPPRSPAPRASPCRGAGKGRRPPPPPAGKSLLGCNPARARGGRRAAPPHAPRRWYFLPPAGNPRRPPARARRAAAPPRPRPGARAPEPREPERGPRAAPPPSARPRLLLRAPGSALAAGLNDGSAGARGAPGPSRPPPPPRPCPVSPSSRIRKPRRPRGPPLPWTRARALRAGDACPRERAPRGDSRARGSPRADPAGSVPPHPGVRAPAAPGSAPAGPPRGPGWAAAWPRSLEGGSKGSWSGPDRPNCGKTPGLPAGPAPGDPSSRAPLSAPRLPCGPGSRSPRASGSPEDTRHARTPPRPRQPAGWGPPLGGGGPAGARPPGVHRSVETRWTSDAKERGPEPRPGPLMPVRLLVHKSLATATPASPPGARGLAGRAQPGLRRPPLGAACSAPGTAEVTGQPPPPGHVGSGAGIEPGSSGALFPPPPPDPGADPCRLSGRRDDPAPETRAEPPSHGPGPFAQARSRHAGAQAPAPVHLPPCAGHTGEQPNSGRLPTPGRTVWGSLQMDHGEEGSKTPPPARKGAFHFLPKRQLESLVREQIRRIRSSHLPRGRRRPPPARLPPGPGPRPPPPAPSSSPPAEPRGPGGAAGRKLAPRPARALRAGLLAAVGLVAGQP
ncbi:basic proline-rich protein-like [Dipodomys merriami]|uniref:basic proline-rich protein-like n=1 Tax=Dipodomys merriami TaxID=94247 RepID=UPI003855F68A